MRYGFKNWGVTSSQCKRKSSGPLSSGPLLPYIPPAILSRDLPLPRSVGVGSEDEVLCAQVDLEQDYDINSIHNSLCRQLPEHCIVSEVIVRPKKVTLHPRSAVYEFAIDRQAITEGFTANLQSLKNAAGGNVPILVNRKSSKKKSLRQMDVSQYVKNVQMENETLSVNCLITQGGSIRIDEIMQQLGISEKDLTSPIKRTNVDWSDC